MKLVLGKGLSKKVYKFFSLATMIFAVSGLFNLQNWFLRILTQGSLCLMMLFMGIHTISQQKDKYQLGYLLIGAAAFTLVVTINTIVVGLKIGAF